MNETDRETIGELTARNREWFVKGYEQCKQDVVAELDTLWARNHETPEKLQKALEDWINYQTDDDLPQDGKEIK